MQRLQDTDSSEPHRRAMRFHLGRLQRFRTSLHVALRAEGKATYDALKAAERTRADLIDDEAETSGAADGAEIDFENAIRTLDSVLAIFDRENPGKGARVTVFPHGFGALIDPDGPAQLSVLPAFHERLKPLRAEPALQDALNKLDAAEAAMRSAFEADAAAETAAKVAFEAEKLARAAVRQQLESAYGKLRDHYKVTPGEAEGFFMKFGRREGKAKKAAPAGPTPPADPNAPAGPTG